MRMADKFGLPIVTLIDTAGAYPGIGAEERHIAEAIAVNLREMMVLETPIVAAVIGEGGSGGALGTRGGSGVDFGKCLLLGDQPGRLRGHPVERPGGRPRAAEALKITADHLLKLGLVDEIIPEPLGGAHNAPEQTAAALKTHLLRHLSELQSWSAADRLQRRYAKFRAIGHFNQPSPTTTPSTSS